MSKMASGYLAKLSRTLCSKVVLANIAEGEVDCDSVSSASSSVAFNDSALLLRVILTSEDVAEASMAS